MKHRASSQHNKNNKYINKSNKNLLDLLLLNNLTTQIQFWGLNIIKKRILFIIN